MSYLVLARKWRPQTFSEVIGQEHITGTLMKAVEKGRLAHAYLFAGPRGCGKTTTARLLAKIINCQNPKGVEPCNECSSCTAITEGRHLDVIEIDGASNRGIDEIRDLREKINYAPAQGRSKIYIIDEVHMLTPQAFNALLKTLEEPPVHVYLVFATTEPHKVPSTILSRCQRFNFKRLELGEISSQLEKICALEKLQCEKEALTLIARRAEGSMRDGESLLDQCIAASEGIVDLDCVRRVLGLVDSQLIVDLLKAIGARDRKGTLMIVDRAVESGLDLEEFFLAYVEGLRNLLILSVGGGASADLLDLSKAEIAELAAIGRAFRTENLLYLFRAATRSYRELKASGQPRYQLEAALTEAASWESAVELSELIRHLDTLGGSGAPGSEAPARKKEGGSAREASGTAPRAARIDSEGVSLYREVSPAPAVEAAVKAGPVEQPTGAFARIDPASMDLTRTAEEEVVLREIGGKEAWERFLSQIRETKLTLGIWLMSARVASIEGERCCLSFSPQYRFAREMVLEEKNRRFIEYHLERFFGRRLMIEVAEHCEAHAAGGDGPPGAKPPAETPRTASSDPALDKIAGDTPVIRRLIDDFNAEIFKESSS